jgi:hypothetical protein
MFLKCTRRLEPRAFADFCGSAASAEYFLTMVID